MDSEIRYYVEGIEITLDELKRYARMGFGPKWYRNPIQWVRFQRILRR
tara:strand:- start:411 stop:554 length:144 start_codon:yes stop_codon:yes gene_type:complete